MSTTQQPLTVEELMGMGFERCDAEARRGRLRSWVEHAEHDSHQWEPVPPVLGFVCETCRCRVISPRCLTFAPRFASIAGR
jgi:hypothetical protein